MVLDSTDGPFAPVIYHHWSSSPTRLARALRHRGKGGSSELSKGFFWLCLFLLRREEGNQMDQGERAGKWQPWGCSDPGRSCSLCSRRGQTPSCPGDCPRHAPCRRVSEPLDKVDDGGGTVAAAAVPNPAIGGCCHDACQSCCLLAGLERQLNALVLRLPPSLGNSLSCLPPLCALMLVTFPEHPRNA